MSGDVGARPYERPWWRRGLVWHEETRDAISSVIAEAHPIGSKLMQKGRVHVTILAGMGHAVIRRGADREVAALKQAAIWNAAQRMRDAHGNLRFDGARVHHDQVPVSSGSTRLKNETRVELRLGAVTYWVIVDDAVLAESIKEVLEDRRSVARPPLGAETGIEELRRELDELRREHCELRGTVEELQRDLKQLHANESPK